MPPREFCRDVPAIIATKKQDPQINYGFALSRSRFADFCYTSGLNRTYKRSKSMGEIVAAFGVCHSPHLLTRPPDEVPEQSEASIAAMRELGKLLDETKPDVILFLGSDHLETFSMTCIPTFAIIAGDRVVAEHGGFRYD